MNRPRSRSGATTSASANDAGEPGTEDDAGKSGPAAGTALVDRWLALASVDDAACRRAKLRAFRSLFALNLALGLSLWAWQWNQDWHRVLVLPLAVAAALVMSGRRVRLGLGLFAACHALKVLSFPLGVAPSFIANHSLLEYLLLAILLLLDHDDDREVELALTAARWLLVLVFFWAGMQKLWHRTYFDGQALGWAVAATPHFKSVLGWLLDPPQLQRLQQFQSGQFLFERGVLIGEPIGSYRTTSLALTLFGNLTWMGEVGFALLLLWRRARPFAMVGAGLLILSIEIAARELVFGALFLNLLLLFSTTNAYRRFAPAFALIYVVLVAARFGLIPLDMVQL